MPKRKLSAHGPEHPNSPQSNGGNSQTTTTSSSPKKRRLRKRRNDKLVSNANDLSISDFQAQHLDVSTLTFTLPNSSPEGKAKEQLYIEFKTASGAHNAGDITSCFLLVEETSKADYAPSSIGWHPVVKQREMRDPSLRYLIVRRHSPTNNKTSPSPEVEAFLSFVLTHDSTPSVPVLYIYEIHLTRPLRGTGLGRHLMQIAEAMAMSVGVEKVMLTCFLSNEQAKGFYEGRGYASDACSPEDRRTREGVKRVDYVILSKVVAKTVETGGEAV